MELPLNATTLILPKNDSIRILAISVARENPEVTPAQPLYDTLRWPRANEKEYIAGTH
jgi:alpha-mannosidase